MPVQGSVLEMHGHLREHAGRGRCAGEPGVHPVLRGRPRGDGHADQRYVRAGRGGRETSTALHGVLVDGSRRSRGWFTCACLLRRQVWSLSSQVFCAQNSRPYGAIGREGSSSAAASKVPAGTVKRARRFRAITK